MASGSLARRYARAVLQIGIDEGNFERIGREVAGLADAFAASEELTRTVSNPAFPRAEREKVLRALLQRLGASQTVVNFARLLLERERVFAVPDIARELAAMIDEQTGRVKARITSAAPLSPTQQEQVVRALEGMSGKKVQAEVGQDPALLGGVVAQVGDTVYDGSLRTQLERLRQGLTR
jgi:F-type H+-transporting ATPase subunit delta